MNEEKQRLFLALWPDDEVRQALVALQHELKRRGIRARATRAENLHLTLAFFGDMTAAESAQLIANLDGISASAPLLNLDHLGHWRRNRVLYLASDEDEPVLNELVQTLRSQLKSLSLADRLNKFRPHITLFRGLGVAPNNWLDIQCIPWRASQLVLVRSTLTPQGAEYQMVRQWELS